MKAWPGVFAVALVVVIAVAGCPRRTPEPPSELPPPPDTAGPEVSLEQLMEQAGEGHRAMMAAVEAADWPAAAEAAGTLHGALDQVKTHNDEAGFQTAATDVQEQLTAAQEAADAGAADAAAQFEAVAAKCDGCHERFRSAGKLFEGPAEPEEEGSE